MAQSLLLSGGRNIIADGINLGRVLESAKLPVNQDTYVEFAPAVANGQIKIAVSTAALELAFKTKGIQEQLLAQCNSPFGVRKKYTFLGALVDENAESASNRAVQVQATVWGRLNAALDEDSATTVAGTAYTVNSISKYTLRIGGVEICRFDLLRGGWLDKDGQRLEIAQMIGA